MITASLQQQQLKRDMNETEERMELKKDKVRTGGDCETNSSDVSPNKCERSIPTKSPYSILLVDIVDDGTEPRKTSTEKCITDTSDNIIGITKTNLILV